MSSLSALCIAFLRITSEGEQLPAHVESLLLERVRAGIHAQAPDVAVTFDRNDCEAKGTYAFGLDQLVLSAEVPAWRGRMLIANTDLLDGRRLDYSPYLVTPALARSLSLVPVPPPTSPAYRKPLLYGLGGAALGAAGGALGSPNEASRPLNILVFALGGALLGSTLAITF